MRAAALTTSRPASVGRKRFPVTVEEREPKIFFQEVLFREVRAAGVTCNTSAALTTVPLSATARTASNCLKVRLIKRTSLFFSLIEIIFTLL